MPQQGRFEAWQDRPACEFAMSTKLLWKFGRAIGILPLESTPGNPGFAQKQLLTRAKQFLFKKFHVLFTVAVGINCAISIAEFSSKNMSRGGAGNRDLIQIASDGRRLLFILCGFLIYFHFCLRLQALQNLIEIWKTTMKSLTLTKPDTNLPNTSRWITIVLLMSMIIEWALFTLKFVPISNMVTTVVDTDKGNGEGNLVSRTLLRLNLFRHSSIIPPHPVYHIFLIVTNTLAFFAWNFADILIMITARALEFKFRALVQISDEGVGGSKGSRPFPWDTVRRDHLQLSSLVKVCENFLSPLIFISFCTNAYNICLQIHDIIIPVNAKNYLETTYAAWSLIHLILRLWLGNYFAAKMNDSAHQISQTIQKTKSMEYSIEMGRLERYLGNHPIAFTGLNCFLLTRSFVLVILSILFTIEIVLLQAKGSATFPTIPAFTAPIGAVFQNCTK